jgi:cytochrome c oxidase subunit IV
MAHDHAHDPAAHAGDHGNLTQHTGGDDHGHGEGHGHGHGTTEAWMVFVVLMVLLFATVGAAYVNLHWGNVPVAYAIASLKAVLILWYFMHLKYSTRLVHVFAFASFAWLALMLIVTLGDYFSRHFNVMRADPRTHIRRVDSFPVQSGVAKSKQMGEGDMRNAREIDDNKRTDHQQR